MFEFFQVIKLVKLCEVLYVIIFLMNFQKENLKLSYKFLLFDLDHTLLDFYAAENVALTQLLKEEGVADIQAYKDYYIPMNKALWKDLEQKKISKQELVNTRFSRLFAHFGQEKTVVFLLSVTNFT